VLGIQPPKLIVGKANHSEVIKLRNEGLEKDKILISLVNKVKEDEASFKAQAEIQKNEIEDLRKQLAEAKEKCGLAEANRDISEYWKNYLEKTIEELRASEERCFEKSLGCVEKIKASFANVGAYSNEDNFIRGDPEGVIEWISGEAEAFEEILSGRGISACSVVPEEFQPSWRRQVVTMSKSWPRPKLPSPWMIQKIPPLKQA
jgi:molecular chaperone GrpE (heat shock protein)